MSSSLLKWAYKELHLLEDKNPDDPMQKIVTKNVMELMETLADQGHSGFSARYVLSTFDRLAKHMPLSPLTGVDDEWHLVGETPDYYQNTRCPRVFKDSTGVYDTEARVFSDDGGETFFSSKYSRQFIQFPYIVKDPERIIFLTREEYEFWAKEHKDDQ